MKRTFNKTICIALALVSLLGLAACKNKKVNAEGLWKDAIYLEDTELGEGKNTAVVEVKADEQSITLTVNTDKETLGAALSEHKIIEGKDGLYTKVNGIEADYNKDGAYWGFYVNGEYATEGMDTTEIKKDVKYKLEYTK